MLSEQGAQIGGTELELKLNGLTLVTPSGDPARVLSPDIRFRCSDCWTWVDIRMT